MKKGFTLIELLAVIVILAIIALIATPIILGIINDAREKANERSVELYASAVRNGIAAYQLVEGREVLPGTYNDTNKLPFDVDYDGNVECTSIIISEDSKVSLEGCTVNGGEKTYNYGIEEEASSLAGTMGICKPVEKQYFAIEPLNPGYKYECDVDPEKPGYDYMFYVLNSNATSVNLIMDSNINISGNAVKGTESDLGLEAWGPYDGVVNDNYKPTIAMDHLQTATAGWTNTNKLTINTFPDENGDLYDIDEYVINARMPYYNEVSDYSVSANNAYLYDNLYRECWADEFYTEKNCGYETKTDVEGLGNIIGVQGYWLLSNRAERFEKPWLVSSGGIIGFEFTNDATNYGVRPVINLSI